MGLVHVIADVEEHLTLLDGPAGGPVGVFLWPQLVAELFQQGHFPLKLLRLGIRGTFQEGGISVVVVGHQVGVNLPDFQHGVGGGLQGVVGTPEHLFIATGILDSLGNGILAILSGQGVDLPDSLILNPWVICHGPTVSAQNGAGGQPTVLIGKRLHLLKEIRVCKLVHPVTPPSSTPLALL